MQFRSFFESDSISFDPWKRKLQQMDMPDDLINDINLLRQEKKWQKAIRTKGAKVRLDDGTEGIVAIPLGSHGRVGIEHKIKDGDVETIGIRFYDPLHVSAWDED